jgi:hypothetical protein
MSASLEILRVNGVAPGVGTVVTDLAAMSADIPTSTPESRSANPLQRPGSGSQFSYEIWFRFRLNAAPSLKVSDIRVWGPANPPADGVRVWLKTVASANYAAPVVPASSSGFTRQDTNYTSEVAALVIPGELVEVGDVSDFVVMVIEVDPAASTGEMPAFQLSYSYMEQ